MEEGEQIFGVGIESSCDDTGAALVAGGSKILANPKFDQTALHEVYGGVVPEIAGRAHLEKIPFMVDTILTAMGDASPPLIRPDYVAVTMKPGLSGSLFTGYYAALAMAKAWDIELIPIHHLEAHLYAVMLEGVPIEYPFLGLLISGGNTAIYRVDDLGKVEILGDTYDDAAGEAFDKAASLLGMGYPGGPEIEKGARRFLEKNPGPHKKSENPLPYILKGQGDSLHFSFSGLKTALYYLLQKGDTHSSEKLAWCFQERVFEILLRNIEKAVQSTGVKRVIAAGGVMANQTLKGRLEGLCKKLGASFASPQPALCTDNAAMVAAAGYLYHSRPEVRRYEEKISPKSGFE